MGSEGSCLFHEKKTQYELESLLQLICSRVSSTICLHTELLIRLRVAVVLSVSTVNVVILIFQARNGEPSGGHFSAGIKEGMLNLGTLL